MKKFLKKWLLLLPRIHAFDTLYHFIYFVRAHHRIPRRYSGLFNDQLFYVKTSLGFDSALRQFVTDKDFVKIYYKGLLGADFAPKTLEKLHSFSELSEKRIPRRCVIKPAHLSGRVFYYDEENGGLTIDQRARIEEWFKTNIYRDISRESNYRQLQPSVICEELISDRTSVRDYKIFCYKGKPCAVQVDIDRHLAHKRRLYTVDWQPLPYSYNKPLADVEARPKNLDLALELAARLAIEFEFIRIDVYLVADRVYLGEMTSVPENAHGRFESPAAERHFSGLVFGMDA